MSAPEMPPIYSSLDEPDMAELVEEFVACLQERVAALDAAVAAGNLAEITRLAHQLKGASGGYGFESVGIAAGELEALSKAAQSADQIRNEVDTVTGLCRRARPAMART